MTQTCKSCREVCCDKMGQDLRACEHYVRLSDVDPQSVVETASSSSQDCPCRECDAIKARLHNVEQQMHDIARAVRGELP